MLEIWVENSLKQNCGIYYQTKIISCHLKNLILKSRMNYIEQRNNSY